MKIDLNLLTIVPFADTSLGVSRIISFDNSDIKKAIFENRLDEHGFQDDIEELKKKWNIDSPTYEEYFERARNYHIERIAYLIVSGDWKFPINVCSNLNTIKDGQHRVLAAKYLGESEIEANIVAC